MRLTLVYYEFKLSLALVYHHFKIKKNPNKNAVRVWILLLTPPLLFNIEIPLNNFCGAKLAAITDLDFHPPPHQLVVPCPQTADLTRSPRYRHRGCLRLVLL